MAELVFFTGTMDCGKSTLAAQVNYTHASRGRRGTHNARTLDGVMVTEGEQVAVGDTASESGVVSYEVLCRRHHMAAMPLNHSTD